MNKLKNDKLLNALCLNDNDNILITLKNMNSGIVLNKFGIKNAIKVSQQNVSLPIYPELTLFEQNMIINLINKFND